MKLSTGIRRAALVAPLCLAAIAPSLAQQATPPTPPAPQAQTPPAAQPAPPPATQPSTPPAARLPGWGPGVMMGPWMMGRGAMGPGFMRGFCNPRMAGFAQWRANRMERWLNPTDAQKAKLEDLKSASAKAAEAIAAACPATAPNTPVEQMQAMEKRLEAMLQAIKTVRPAFEAFYATLSDQQKAQLGPRNRGREYGPRRGRGWDRW